MRKIRRQDPLAFDAPRRKASHNPVAAYAGMGTCLLFLSFIGAVAVFDRKDLPEGMRDNPVVVEAYRQKIVLAKIAHAALRSPKAAPGDEDDRGGDAAGQGYSSQDRKRLEKLFGEGASP